MQNKFIEELLWLQKFEIELKKPEPETDLEICGFGSKNKKNWRLQVRNPSINPLVPRTAFHSPLYYPANKTSLQTDAKRWKSNYYVH